MNFQPFSPRAHATQKISVAAASNNKVVLPAQTCQIWVDNRGITDLLVEFDDQPVEGNSFRVPPSSVVILTHPYDGVQQNIYLSRPTGAATEDAYVTPGGGF